MRLPWAPLALLVCASFSGCAGLFASADQALAVHVPALGVQESWTTQHRGTFADDGFSTTFSSAITTRVEPGPDARLDSYGFPVDVFLLSIRGEHEAEVRQGQSSQSESSTSASEAAIEKGGGNWLIFGTHPLWGGSATGLCKSDDAVRDEIVSYAREPIRHDFGTLRGHTIRLGDKVVEERHGDHPYLGRYHLRSEHVVVAQETLDLRLNGKGVRLPVLVVEHDTVVDYEALRPSSSGPRPVHRAYYADGIGVPVRTVVVDDEDGAKFRTTSTLSDYTPGKRPLEFNGRVLARFGGVHPAANAAPYRFAPDLTDVHFEFPLEEALAAIATNPRSAPFALWLQQHPTAYASEGAYRRDVVRDTYHWTLGVTDGNDLWSLAVQRSHHRGQAVDSVDASERTTGRGLATPDRVRSTEVVDAKTALGVGQRFLPGDGWEQMGWRVAETAVAAQPLVTIQLAHVHTEHKGGAGPVKTEYQTLRAPTRTVDARTGSVLSSGGIGLSCGPGLFLDLPV